jgi:glycosyltransferase involved in cell wall biosynthesis
MQTLEPFPLVTVLMPVYNGERFVLDAVASILAQTFKDFELLVIDDGSTDKTRNLLETISDPRLHILANPTNLGLIATLNRGLELAHGRYVARMDADDVAHPQRLERQITFLEAHPEVAVLGTAVDLINADGKRFSGLHYPCDPEKIRQLLPEECSLIHPTVVFRRDIVLAEGGYNSAARHAEDYDLWLRLSERHQLANLPDPLLGYRIHPAQVSITNLRTQYETVQSIREKALARRQASGQNVAAFKQSIRPTRWGQLRARPCTLGRDYLNWYRHYRVMRQPKLAMAFAVQGLRHSPLSAEAWIGLVVAAWQLIVPQAAQRAFAWYRHRLVNLFSANNRLS